MEEGGERKCKQESTKVEVELFETTSHGPTAGTLRDPTTVLFANEGVDTARAETADALWTSIALFQYAQSSTTSAVYLDGIREHGRRIRGIQRHDLQVCA